MVCKIFTKVVTFYKYLENKFKKCKMHEDSLAVEKKGGGDELVYARCTCYSI